jgi:hypothetical protein
MPAIHITQKLYEKICKQADEKGVDRKHIPWTINEVLEKLVTADKLPWPVWDDSL